MTVWMQTASGRAFDMIAPTAAEVDFDDIAEHLAKLPRWNGATPNIFYSVAQHCVHASELAFKETGNNAVAAAVLLHDAHEAYIGDDILPKQLALVDLANMIDPAMGSLIEQTHRRLRHGIDCAIHRAAGLEFPHDPTTRKIVKRIDAAMLEAERRQLVGDCLRPWHGNVEAADVELKPWAWQLAREAFSRRVVVYIKGSLVVS
jgi:5'-deoxynucleotidase YfbR-like HD superfamily hydrolase